MWHTPSGERILRGHEWNLFSLGLSLLWDQIEASIDDPEPDLTGVRVFDRLESPAKLAMLAIVGAALHDEHEACPELTALTEGTFAAVYATIRQWIELEIDGGDEEPSAECDEPSMRDLVLAAMREVQAQWVEAEPHSSSTGDDEGEVDAIQLPDAESEDHGAWADVLDVLMDRVLWADRDFEEEEQALDLDPDLCRAIKAQLGIDEDYFIAVAPEPSEKELGLIRGTLDRLCRSPERRQDGDNR